MRYVGLTDDPVFRREDHGNPKDWKQFSFSSELEARNWEKELLSKPGYQSGPNNDGWRYGYTYTINGFTRE